MNKKIKVIELINKIYANLDVPKRVKLNTYTFEYCEEEQDFYDEKHSTFLICDYAQSHSKWLDVEIEILEEEEEINIDSIEEIPIDKDEFGYETVVISDLVMSQKINEIIKKVNKLDKKINTED